MSHDKSAASRARRYGEDAFQFIADAVVFAVARDTPPGGGPHHVPASAVLAGVRDYAVEKFGAVGPEVLRSWGVRTADDVGELVFELARRGMLRIGPDDHREDFSVDFSFDVDWAGIRASHNDR